MKMTENNKGEKTNMYKITLKKMTKKDFPLIKQWLESDKFKNYYKSYTTIDQLKNKINGENSYIDFFMININSEKIGFCQYYDCFTAQKFCENIDKENIRYCIDYVMIKYIDGVYDQFELVKKLIKIIKKKNGKEIILYNLGIKTLKAFIPNGFQFDKGHIYKIL
jgi:hypothetical protein